MSDYYKLKSIQESGRAILFEEWYELLKVNQPKERSDDNSIVKFSLDSVDYI